MLTVLLTDWVLGFASLPISRKPTFFLLDPHIAVREGGHACRVSLMGTLVTLMMFSLS